MPYPDLPKQRLIIVDNGKDIDLSEKYGLVLVDGYTLGTPEYDTKTVEISGVETVIDLTDSLIGDVMFKNRTNSFNMYILYPKDITSLKNKIFNFLHGKRYDYKLSFDPDYTYNGRFTISSCTCTNDLAAFSISVDSKPYKYKPTQKYNLNPYHGKAYVFDSGRKPVRPIIECDSVCYVAFNGKEYTIPAGTHTLNKVLFKEGQNEIYLNSKREHQTTWDRFQEFCEGEAYDWDTLKNKSLRWDYIYVLDTEFYGLSFKSWNDVHDFCCKNNLSWSFIGDGGIGLPWDFLRLTPDIPESDKKYLAVYFNYEWGDL